MKKSKIALVVVCLAAVTFALLFFLTSGRNEPKPPALSAAAPHKQIPAPPPETKYGLPVRIKIPKINVDAAVEQSGLTAKGDMQEPGKLQDVGWYKLGPRPGDVGSAVLAGHYGLHDQDTAVFNKLHTLNKDDVIYVQDENGTETTFIVRELKTYRRDAAAPEVFYSNDKKAHLNLITCGGLWQNAQQTYTDRIVVFADLK